MRCISSLILVSALAIPSAHAAVMTRPAIPIVFEPLERGETVYRARTSEYEIFLGRSGAILEAPGRPPIRMTLLGASSGATLSPLDPQPGVVNYLIGDRPGRWRTSVPTFGRIAYSNVYPGIDLLYYSNGQAIEFDLIVAPGASASAIRLCIEGAEAHLSADGDLTVDEFTIRRPDIYQTSGDQRIAVAGRYRLHGPHEVGFDIDGFDGGKPLVIDPVVVRYATYLGGSLGEVAFGVAVDGDHNVYVTGVTSSRDLPASADALQLSNAGGIDVYVMKLSADGRLVYCTYLGGSDSEVGGPGQGDGWNDIAVDAVGNVYLTGSTRSRDFPVTAGAMQPKFAGGSDDGFVAKLSADGRRLLYSTYLGGSGEDQMRAIDIDRTGSAYVTGRTMSHDFPTASAFQEKHGGGVDAFVTKLSPDGSSIIYSSFLGGSDLEVGRDIAVDAAGGAYIAGRTLSINFPATAGAFQTKFSGFGPQGQGDAFAAKVSPDGSLAYATFLGGSRGEIAAGIDVDSSGHAYVVGITESADFPTTAGSFQSRYAGGPADAFVTKLDPRGRTAVYSTFIGGSDGDEECFGVAVDVRGQAHCAGTTFSRTFPTLHAFQETFGGPPNDAFVAKLDATGSHLLYSSYLGGNGVENAFRIALDSSGNAYVAGGTRATDFPATASALHPTSRGGSDAFLACISHLEQLEEGESRVIPVVGAAPGSHGSFFRTSLQLHNPSDEVIGGTIVYRAGGSAEATATLPYLAGPRQTLSFASLLEVMGKSGIGSADVVFPPGQKPVVVARIFQDGGLSGTSGMSETPVHADAALRPGQAGFLIGPLDPLSARLNIGMRALDDGATIRFVRRNTEGAAINSVERAVDPNVFVQVGADDLMGQPLAASDSITVHVDRGSAIVYGATTDNRTNDPSLQYAVTAASVEGEKRIVPVVGSVRGAFGSNFRTSVQLHNPTEDEIGGEMVFHHAGGSGEVAQAYTLRPRATAAWDDLPSSMGVSGLGTLEVRPGRGLSPVSVVRIYNDLGEGGTTGMTIDALRESDALESGGTAILIAPPDPIRARFSIGVATLDGAATIRATIRDSGGHLVHIEELSFPPRALVQRDARSMLGVTLGGTDSIELTVLSGRAIIYGAATDNVTNDPSLQLAAR